MHTNLKMRIYMCGVCSRIAIIGSIGILDIFSSILYQLLAASSKLDISIKFSGISIITTISSNFYLDFKFFFSNSCQNFKMIKKC